MNSKFKELKKSRLKVMIAMLIWGSVGIFVKNIQLSSIEIAFYRSVIGCLFIVLLSLMNKERYDLKIIKKNLKILIISGIVLGLGWVLLFQGFKNTTIAISTLSYYVAPVFIVILSFFILKEKITLKKILCIIGSMIGLLLIINTNEINSSGYNHIIGITYSVLAAIFYATVVILNKFIKNLPGTIVTIIQLFFSAIVLLPLIFLNGIFDIKNFDIKSLILILIVGIFHTGIAYLLYFSSIKDVDGQSLAILSYIDPIFALILSSVLLDEKMTPIQIVGGILILGSTYISERKKKVLSEKGDD